MLMVFIGFSATAQTLKSTQTDTSLTKEQRLAVIKTVLDSTNLVQSDKTNCLEMVNWWLNKKEMIISDTTLTTTERKKQLEITGATIIIRLTKMISAYYVSMISPYIN